MTRITPNVRLMQIGREIEARIPKAKKADDHTISIERLLVEARRLCENDKAFEQWKTKHCPSLGIFVVSRTRFYEKLRIAAGKTTAEEVRAKGRARVEKHRAKHKQVTSVTSGPDYSILFADTPKGLTGAKLAAHTRKWRKASDMLVAAYREKFPQWQGGVIGPDHYRAMARSLETGIEQPILVKQREEIERNIAEHDAELAAEHAEPFTPELEAHYTARIKQRRLIEGDCERPWQNYFAYREAHPDEVEPLDETDLAYVGQWTTCARRQPDPAAAPLTSAEALRSFEAVCEIMLPLMNDDDDLRKAAIAFCKQIENLPPDSFLGRVFKQCESETIGAVLEENK